MAGCRDHGWCLFQNVEWKFFFFLRDNYQESQAINSQIRQDSYLKVLYPSYCARKQEPDSVTGSEQQPAGNMRQHIQSTKVVHTETQWTYTSLTKACNIL